MQKDCVLYSKEVKFPINQVQSTIVVAGNGSGKNKCYLEPNIKNSANNTLVITDVGENLLDASKNDLLKKGYQVCVLNFDTTKGALSNFNPLAYISNDISEIISFVRDFIRQTNGDMHGADIFWEETETILLSAVVSYVLTEFKEHPDKQNLLTVKNILSGLSTMSEEDADAFFANTTDATLRCWQGFSAVSGKVKNAIFISALVRFSMFSHPAVQDSVTKNDIDVNIINENKKIAIFIETSSVDTSLSFLYVSAVQTLLKLAYQADKGKKRKNKVRFIFDDLLGLGKLSLLSKYVSAASIHNVVFDLVVPSIEQFETTYKDEFPILLATSNIVIFDSTSHFEWVFFQNLLSESKLSVNNISLSDLPAQKCVIYINGNVMIGDKISLDNIAETSTM
jgi:type IV secretion system protein VirD4